MRDGIFHDVQGRTGERVTGGGKRLLIRRDINDIESGEAGGERPGTEIGSYNNFGYSKIPPAMHPKVHIYHHGQLVTWSPLDPA